VISCTEAVRQLWEYIDGTVDHQSRAEIEEHLAFCRRCCGEVEFAHELSRFLAEHGNGAIPADVRARLQATLATLEGSQ
jgi:anti-sigma factor (TIGR02949 family)